MPLWTVSLTGNKKQNSSVMIQLIFLGGNKISVSYKSMEGIKWQGKK